ncbi:MAG TPA: hypothetical protein DHW63_08820 [Hyphomonadaceae bacterium]|nr:hypothetical protein [Hyphomonadaceae bacterium]
MLARIFPSQASNEYRGYKFAIWLLIAIVLLRLAMSYAALIDTRAMLQDADSIPLDKFDAGAASTVLYITKLLGLDHLLLNVVAIVVLIRWRALVPFVYLLLAVEQIARKAINTANPVPRTDIAILPVDPNLVIIAALLVGLALSLATPRRSAPRN